jgi:replicative DNA helicase
MTREEIIEQNPITTFLQDKGHQIKRIGGSLTTNACPLSEHKEGHNCASIDPEKNIWHCNDCGVGGSVIDWVRFEKQCGLRQAFDSFGTTESAKPNGEAKIAETYDYTDENGRLQYQVVRLEPKDFRQRQPTLDGKWEWNLEGVTRVLYNLPRVLLSPLVCVTEGEKDAQTLIKHGMVATTNAGGAEKWLGAYAETLRGKDVLVFRDMDAKGQRHADRVVDSIREKALSVKIIQMPKGYKDVTEYLSSIQQDEQLKALNKLIGDTPHLIEPLPIYSLKEMEDDYREFLKNSDKSCFAMSKFDKRFAGLVEDLTPGELVLMVGDTGVGKTAVMQTIAKSAKPLSTLFFELELPLQVMFARGVQMQMNCYLRDVKSDYKDSTESFMKRYDDLKHIMVCPQSGISMDNIERYVERSSLKFGQRPALVMVDYAGLVKDDRFKSRYEQIAHTAEQAKVVAKRTNTIMFLGSQVARPADKKMVKDVFLHMAKGAGELESSANLVLGLGRPEQNKLKMKIIKSSHGPTGDILEYDFDGARMQITPPALKNFKAF